MQVAVKIVPRAANLQVKKSQYSSVREAKQAAKEQAREQNREMRTIREAHIMMLLRHPHIVGLKDMIVQGQYFYILMDYVNGGQLLHYIVKRQRLSQRRARHFARQIISALDYLHRNSIVHRDLKIENIMIDKSGRNVKIIDFGLSNLFGPERLLTTYCGSLYFAAPELLHATPYKGPEVDVWSLGVVIYVMVTGAVPFDDQNMAGLHEKIKRARVAYPSYLSDECYDLLSKIFVANPKERITLAQIMRHPWFELDHLGTINNFLPPRAPIRFPLDPVIIEQMTHGFGLGTADEIQRKMEVIVGSHIYQDAAEMVAEWQSIDGKPPSPPQENGSWLPYDDPQAVPDAYHPLVSIYHLTRERLAQQQQESQVAVAVRPGGGLSRKSSVESTGSITGVSIGGGSQHSLDGHTNDQAAVRWSPEPPTQQHEAIASVLSQPRSLPNRPDYQLIADASIPGFSSQPSTADYFGRIQRWLRSEPSQHNLNEPQTTPLPQQPQQQQQQQQQQKQQEQQQQALQTPPQEVSPSHSPMPTPPAEDIVEAISLPQSPEEPTPDLTPATPPYQPADAKPARSLFRKFSNALLRRNTDEVSPGHQRNPSTGSSSAASSTVPAATMATTAASSTAVSTPTTTSHTLPMNKLHDRPLPPLPPQKAQRPPMPTASASSTMPKSKKQTRHQRSASSSSTGQAGSLTRKLGSWLARSSSLRHQQRQPAVPPVPVPEPKV